MKIIIDISKGRYEDILSGKEFTTYQCDIREVLKNGTPLPEPFDLEGLKKDMKALNCGYPYGLDYLLNCLNKRLGITINGK